jgi:hypothetical protein
MKVEHLIAALQQVPTGTKVYYEGAYKDDWQEVRKAEYAIILGQKGVYLK